MLHKIKTTVVILFLMCANCIAAQHHHRSALLERADAQAMNQWVEEKFNAMSEREKVAQLVILTVAPTANAENVTRIKNYLAVNGANA